MSSTGEPPPPVLVSNPDDNYQTAIIVCAVITWLIATAFVGLRFYTRRWLLHVLGREDWVILGSLVFSALSSAGTIEQVAHGFGRHTLDIPFPSFSPMAKAGWYTILWYQLSFFCTKTSILLLYIRILSYPGARRSAGFLLGLVVVSNIWTFVATLTACIPLSAFWDFSLMFDSTKKVYCHPRSFWWANTGLHMVTDFLIFSLPMPVLWKLKAGNKRRDKVLLVGIFAFGFVTSLMSVIRLLYLLKEYTSPDFTYDTVGLAYWTCIEVNTAIVCSCVMTLKPLVNRWFPVLSRQAARRDGNGSSEVGGMRPLTIGSMPVREHGARNQSWVVLPHHRTMSEEGTKEELEMISQVKSMETRLNKKLEMPVRPDSAHILDPR